MTVQGTSPTDHAASGRIVLLTIAALGILVAVAIGIQYRMEDPYSTSVLPAEDTYNHMALVREHLRDGNVEPLNPNGALYPPGMHAFLAAWWVYTGSDLYEIMRAGPIVFGALGILGMAALLWRFHGPVAGFAGALGTAVAPELILRTTMMAPTAVDLALLPFFLYALIEVMGGRLAWTAAAAPLALFFAFSHPWLLSVLAVVGAVYLLLVLALPWAKDHARTITVAGAAVAIAIIGIGTAFSLSGCWGACGPGFRDILPDGQRLGMLAPLAFLLAVLPLVALAAIPRTWRNRSIQPRPRVPLFGRIAASILLALLLTALLVPAHLNGLPQFVDLVAMLGWPLLALATVGILLLPHRPGPLIHLGAAIVLATLPFVIYNPFDSPFWPHRTVAYLAIGIILLAGIAVAAVARFFAYAARVGASTQKRWAAKAATPALGIVLILLVAGSAGATLYAATPPAQHWYRLFDECEQGVLEDLAEHVSPLEQAIIITGAWQPKLVLAALTEDATRVWFVTEFFTVPSERERLAGDLGGHAIPLFVVVDEYVQSNPRADTAFVHEDRWHAFGSRCESDDAENPRIAVYALEGRTT